MSGGDEIYTGLFFERDDRETLNNLEPVLREGPLASQPLGLSDEQAERLIDRMM